MIYDSDSIGTANPTTVPLEGYLTSATINCASHSSVQLQFQEKYRKFNDSSFVEVSNDNGATWTQFPVLANNSLANNSSTANPQIVTINISPVAAGMPNVKIRFHYKGIAAGGSYSWLIDDVVLSELDPVQIELARPGVLLQTGGSFVGFGAVPIQFVNMPLIPYAFLNNNGGTAQTGLDVNAKIYDGTALVYDKTVVSGPLPVAAMDSLVAWEDPNDFTVPDTGFYTAAFRVDAPGDAMPENNVDTAFFNITSDLYSMNVGNLTGSYILHQPASSSGPARSFVIGTRFEIPASTMDTLTGLRAAFASSTTAGSAVNAQIFKFDPGSLAWVFVVDMKPKTLTAAEISTSSALKFATFEPDYDLNGVEAYVLDGGAEGVTYAAVVQTNNVTPTQTVTIYASETPATDFVQFSGLGDTSLNNGMINFGVAGLPFGLETAPLVQLLFGDASTVGISNVNNAVAIGNAYPNPANSKVTIPVQVKENGNVTVTVTNAVGQVMANRNLGNVTAGFSNNVTINTANFANGVYIYTVEVNGKRSTGRFAVSR